MAKMLKMRSIGFRLHETSLHRLHQSFFKTNTKQIMIFLDHSPTSKHLSDFEQVAFFDAQDAENELTWRFTIGSWNSAKSFFNTSEDR
jgi:hypothetical protein